MFQQALEEAGERWGTHKKIINLADKKNKTVRTNVPPGFSYFSVDFGLQPGYVHIIENEETFPGYFAQEVVGGILDLFHKKWKNVERETQESLRDKRDEFRKRWDNFDWTKIAKARLEEDEAGSSK